MSMIDSLRRAADRSEWNRQARFLAGRAYPSDLIYRVLDRLHGDC